MRLVHSTTGVVVNIADDTRLGPGWGPADVGPQLYDEMTVTDLKDEIRLRNKSGSDLAVTGSKAELVSALESDDRQE